MKPLTAVALRYQVLVEASRAKFGKTRPSTRPVESSSETSGSSSSTIITTGGRSSPVPTEASAEPLSETPTREPVGDTRRNSNAKASGAGVRNVT